MFERVLQRLRQLVHTSRYVMTSHGLDEMEADGLNLFDVERCLLTGHIVERQRDRDTGEWKYLVSGQSPRATLSWSLSRSQRRVSSSSSPCSSCRG